ncbi:MAG: thioredoxin family protein [Candidatus Delongbacteria bacterium]|nr:thioredoxin family protein [Candidatus Delongbacteria bacterium]MBN2836587.1 thioredoxin family protein [Candidatus Delongbacteria bacterium]
MKKGIILTVFFAIIIAVFTLTANENTVSSNSKINWETDFQKAMKLAKDENKKLFVDFTGSDWCKWCFKLDGEVFDHQEFADFVHSKYIPVKLDYPRKKVQSDLEKKQNKELLEKYGVRGFPTVLIIDKEGVAVAQTGYQAGGPKNYIEHLKQIDK